MEHQRLVQELEDLEKSASSFDIVVRERQTELEKVNTAVQSMETDVKDLRELDDARKIWTADAMRIALQRDTVNQKEADFQLMNSDVKGRDLKQVEAELLDMSSKKDEYTDKITKLNAELTTINDRVSNYSITATRLENQLRSMEAKYEEELKNDERKDELNKKYAEMKAEQDTLSNQIAPLNQRIETKDSYKTRARKLAEEEENRFSSTLASFNNDVTALQNIVDSIEDYDKSNSQDDMEKIEEEKKKLIDKSKAKMEELKKLRPDIKRLADIVDNQQQQKQNLEGNITLVQSLQKIKLYNNEMAEIEAELSQHESFSSLQADLQSLGKQNNGLIESKARLEGRRGEVIDNQRALKRKLQAKEYRDVEEQFRKASIKQDTTGKC
ncbi:MAG: putative nucleic acid-binding Zn-ribbon protein [Bacillariaceae sp.]